jgi:glutamate synthase (ferredoxin)
MLNGLGTKPAIKNFLIAATKGIVKILSKMGISAIQSYCGAQIFEALGIHQSVIDRYFTWTPSRIGGIDIDIIAREAEMRHKLGYRPLGTNTLPTGGEYQWRQDGEYHLFNPQTIHKLQKAVRNDSYADFKEYSALLNAENAQKGTLRALFEFKEMGRSIPLDEVEPVENILRRFKTER